MPTSSSLPATHSAAARSPALVSVYGLVVSIRISSEQQLDDLLLGTGEGRRCVLGHGAIVPPAGSCPLRVIWTCTVPLSLPKAIG